jgi:hypothetical protein
MQNVNTTAVFCWIRGKHMARYHVAGISIKIASITKTPALIFNIKREALLDALKF